MVFDNRRIGAQGPAGAPPSPVAAPAVPAAAPPADGRTGELPPPPGLATDATQVQVNTAQRAGAAGKPVDFDAAFSAEVQKTLPGARLTGEWSVEQIQSLKATIEGIPTALAQRVQGTEFVLQQDADRAEVDAQRQDDHAKQAEMAQVVKALRVNQTKAVTIDRKAFNLPGVNGVPGFKRALLHELGMLMNERPQKLHEYAKLSGWKQTHFDQHGGVLERPREATGFATNEAGANAPGTGQLSAEAPKVPTEAEIRAALAQPQRPLPPPVQPGRRLPPPAGTRPLNAPPQAPSRPLGSGPLGARPGLGRSTPLPTPSGSGPLGTQRPIKPVAAIDPVGAEKIEGGSRVTYSDRTSVTYRHAPDARFLPGARQPGGPRDDFAQAFEAYMLDPKALMAAAPEKFLFINAEAKRYPVPEVLALARAAGHDPTQVVTSLVVGGRATQGAIDRMCDAHGLAADKVALLAKDQELLGRGANMEAIVERLSLDIGLHGAATTALLTLGTELQGRHQALLAKLTLSREGGGLGTRSRVVSWLVSKATGRRRRLAELDEDLDDVRGEFMRLPFAVQLRTDPRLALGATWFTLSERERALLTSSEGVQRLIARAADRADDIAYIPQRLTPNERALLAYRTLVDACFDPSSQGAALRGRLAGLDGHAANPEAALQELRARNGEPVWTLLSEEQRRALTQLGTQAALKRLLASPELEGALGELREGTTGSVHLKARLLRFMTTEVRANEELGAQLGGVLDAVRQTRADLLARLGRSPLEVALTVINRQVQAGNMAFIQRFLMTDGTRALDGALGPWVAGALSPAERRLLEDPDYRRHLVANAEQIRSTGRSLLDEARQYASQTASLQAALDALLEPDALFSAEFARDPVTALKRRGLWETLPEVLTAEIAKHDRKLTIAHMVTTIQETLGPALDKRPGRQRRLESLARAVRGVNAGNYKGLVGLFDLAPAELTRTLRAGLTDAMDGGAEPEPGGPLRFV